MLTLIGPGRSIVGLCAAHCRPPYARETAVSAYRLPTISEYASGMSTATTHGFSPAMREAASIKADKSTELLKWPDEAGTPGAAPKNVRTTALRQEVPSRSCASGQSQPHLGFLRSMPRRYRVLSSFKYPRLRSVRVKVYELINTT